MFFYRLLSTLVLLSLFLYSMLSDSIWATLVFAALAITMSYVSVIEFCKMLQQTGLDSHKKITAMAVSITVALILAGKGVSYFAILVPFIFCLKMWFAMLFMKSRHEYFQKIQGSVTIFFMLAFPYALIALLYIFKGDSVSGKMLLLFMILVTKSGDIGAYVTGTLTNKLLPGGNHKMVPSISPGKSWEGTLGGLLVSVFISILIFHFLKINGSVIEPVILGVILFVGGMSGDLAESALKRLCKVKDSGNMLPGIGGALDLVDSMIINIILFYVYLLCKFLIYANA